MKGGYQILDFHGVDLVAGTAANQIDGIYEVLDGNYRKPVLVHNLMIGGTEYVDAFVPVKLVAGSYVFSVHGFDFVVADTDAIQVTAVEVEVD